MAVLPNDDDDDDNDDNNNDNNNENDNDDDDDDTYIKEYEMLGLMCDECSEITTYNAMPSWQ